MARSYNIQKAPMPVDWDRKLAQGEAFEQRIIELFESQGHQAWKPNDRTYDLRINIEVPYYGSLALTGECKFDAMANSTKRLALQVWDGGKPRGIHPKGPCPDLWIHGVGDEAWIVRTSFVRSMVETLNLRPVETGDVGMRARCVLVPIEQAKRLVGGTWLSL